MRPVVIALSISLVCGAVGPAHVQRAYQPPFGNWVRLDEARPILSPRGDGFEATGVFNPAVIKVGGRFVMLYRAQDGIRLGRPRPADRQALDTQAASAPGTDRGPTGTNLERQVLGGSRHRRRS